MSRVPITDTGALTCTPVTVIVPARGEELTLPVTMPAILREVSALPVRAQLVVVVPRGSTASSMVPTDDRVRWVEVEKPGKFEALRAGAAHANGDVLILIDADVEPGASSFTTLLDRITTDGDDVVAGRIVLARTPPAARPAIFEHWSAISAAAWHEFRSAETDHRWALPGAMYALRREFLPTRLVVPLVDDASIGLHAARAGARFGYAPTATVTVRAPLTWSDWNRQKLRSRRGWHALSRHHPIEVESLRSDFRHYLHRAAGGATGTRLMRAQDCALRLVAKLSQQSDDALNGSWEPQRRNEQWAVVR